MLPNVKISNQFANIAKGTTDTGYWIFNLNFLFNWIWILLSCRGNSSYGLNSLWVRWYFQKWPYQYWYCHFWNVLIYWLLICLIDILNTLILTRRSIPNPLRCYIHLRWRFLLSSFEGFYLLNAFAGLANPPAELPEGGCGLFNWKSWMKYPETHSLEVTLQKGREGILCLQSFRNNFFILRIRLLSFLEKGKISSLCHHLEISQGRITLENFLYNCVSTTISNTILSPAPSGN